MLDVMTIRPPLSDLYKLIDKVSRYPLDNRQLVRFATEVRAPKDVVAFYQTIDADRVYRTKDELVTLSEQIDLLRQEKPQMPPEIEQSTEEY